MRCSNCGTDNSVGSRFYNQCAAPLGKRPESLRPSSKDFSRLRELAIISARSSWESSTVRRLPRASLILDRLQVRRRPRFKNRLQNPVHAHKAQPRCPRVRPWGFMPHRFSSLVRRFRVYVGRRTARPRTPSPSVLPKSENDPARPKILLAAPGRESSRPSCPFLFPEQDRRFAVTRCWSRGNSLPSHSTSSVRHGKTYLSARSGKAHSPAKDPPVRAPSCTRMKADRGFALTRCWSEGDSNSWRLRKARSFSGVTPLKPFRELASERSCRQILAEKRPTSTSLHKGGKGQRGPAVHKEDRRFESPLLQQRVSANRRNRNIDS